MEGQIQKQYSIERITSPTRIKAILYEKSARITIKDIDRESAKLPTIMARCITVQKSNNFHV